ncbi:MAG TPA: penicillin-binding transpeptidase domain-containing protein [Anaerolineaceae bacterium]|nr:penicillin-binding transpeptidase domain-containing protein [Anaerolineaceae bacterium]
MKPPFFTRYIILGFVASIVGVAILVQIVRIQNSDIAADLRAQGQLYGGEYRMVYPERGNIYDRWGHLLAGNQTVYEIGADLQSVKNPETIASALTTVAGADYATVLERAHKPFIEGESVYIRLIDMVTADQVATLTQMVEQYEVEAADARRGTTPASLAGLVYTPHLKRSYPEAELASNILGFFSFLDPETGKGYFGVEEKYNDLLAGTPQKVYIPFDPNKAQEIPEVPAGTSLILTIDREIQAMVEKRLDEHIQKSGAVSGTAIVMDPKTGEILAMATTPRMDLNNYWEYGDIFPNPTPFNRAVGTTYEPGSVFKVLTMAAALDNGTVTPRYALRRHRHIRDRRRVRA